MTHVFIPPTATAPDRPARRRAPPGLCGSLLALTLLGVGCTAETPVEVDPNADADVADSALGDAAPTLDAGPVDAMQAHDTAPIDATGAADAAPLDASPDGEPTDAALADAAPGPPGQGWQIAEGSPTFPTACGGARPLYDGPLCGGDEVPCAVMRADVVDPEPHYRNAAPAIAVRDDGTVEMLYSVAEGGYHGHHARRTANGWDTHPIPPDLATAGLVFDAEGRAWATAYGGGPLSTTLWTWPTDADVDDFEALGPLPGANARGPESLVMDDGGCLHLATDGALAWSRFDGDDWVRGEHTRRTSSPIDIEISPGGHVHLAGRIEIAGGWSVVWALPSGAVDGGRIIETVFPIRADTLDPRPAYMVLTPATPEMPEGIPHVFSTDGVSLRHAVRTGRNAWTTTAIANDAALGEAGCNEGAETNAPPGDTCINHRRIAFPYGLVASAKGDVRLVWGETHLITTLTAERFHGLPGGPDPVVWIEFEPEAGEAFTELYVGAVVDGELQRSDPIRLELAPLGATVVLDLSGQIHLGLYSRVRQARFDVHALSLGPAR